MSFPAAVASTTTRLCQWSGTAAMMQSMSLRSRSSWYLRVTGRLDLPVIRGELMTAIQRSAAPTHSMPGKRGGGGEEAGTLHADADNSKRTWSLGGT